MILEYFRSKTDYSKKGHHGAQAPTYQTQHSVPMEIDAYFKKGKGKGKGRKGGKTGKGKGSKSSSTKGKSWVWNTPATTTGKGKGPMEGIEETRPKAKGKGKAKTSKGTQRVCTICGKTGHDASYCWQRVAAVTS